MMATWFTLRLFCLRKTSPLFSLVKRPDRPQCQFERGEEFPLLFVLSLWPSSPYLGIGTATCMFVLLSHMCVYWTYSFISSWFNDTVGNSACNWMIVNYELEKIWKEEFVTFFLMNEENVQQPSAAIVGIEGGTESISRIRNAIVEADCLV